MDETDVRMGETNVKMSKTKVKMGESEMIVGIDLGTCNSSAAIIQRGKSQLIAFSSCSRIEGQYVLPSYVAYDQKGDVAFVGEAARGQANTNSKGTFYNVKRLIGKQYEDGLKEAKTLNLSYDIIKGDDGLVKLKLENKTLYPHEITSEILRQIKKDAEENLKEVINSAVITVPAYFNDDGRKYTRKAGEFAGLKVVHVLVEPAAALLTYSKIVGMEKMYPYLFSLGSDYKQHLHDGPVSNELRSAFENNRCPLTIIAEISSVSGNKWEIRDEKMMYEIKESGIQLKIYKSNPNIMVFDIGAGTLDIVIMSYKKVMGEAVIPAGKDTKIYDEDEVESQTKFEPLVYEGDNSLGGANMDAEIMNYVLKEIKDEYHIDLKNDGSLLIELKKKAEEAKISLSKKENTIISLLCGQEEFEVPLTRVKLEELISPDIDKCRNVIKRAIKELKEKGIEKEEIDDIILVGGPTRMPIIQKMIENEVGKPLRKIENIHDWNPMTCVATGAALWIDIYKGTDVPEEEKKGDIMIEGTAYDWGIIKNMDTNPVLIKFIEKGTYYPTKGYYPIPLPKMQDRARILICQINPDNLKDRVNLGKYEFRIVPLAKPREIDVIFDLNDNGELSVTMTNKEENESLKFAGIVADESNRDIKITAVLSPDEEKSKKIEEEKILLDKMKKETEEEIKKLGPKQLDAMMMMAAQQKMMEAFSLAQAVLNIGTSVEDRNRISKKQEDLNKLYGDRESIPTPQYYANAIKLSNDLIETCEKVVPTISDDEVDKSIIKANKLREKIERYSGIHSDISEKISELEMVIGDTQLSNNKKYIRIEGRIEEISHLLKKHKINI